MAAARFLRGALLDLADIRAFIARESRSAAVAEASRRVCAPAATRSAGLPGTLGRAREDLAPGLRSVAYGNYLILFRYEADRLRIIRILHGPRDLPAVLRDPPEGGRHA